MGPRKENENENEEAGADHEEASTHSGKAPALCRTLMAPFFLQTELNEEEDKDMLDSVRAFR